jgi:hypothetical protein
MFRCSNGLRNWQGILQCWSWGGTASHEVSDFTGSLWRRVAGSCERAWEDAGSQGLCRKKKEKGGGVFLPDVTACLGLGRFDLFASTLGEM